MFPLQRQCMIRGGRAATSGGGSPLPAARRCFPSLMLMSCDVLQTIFPSGSNRASVCLLLTAWTHSEEGNIKKKKKQPQDDWQDPLQPHNAEQHFGLWGVCVNYLCVPPSCPAVPTPVLTKQLYKEIVFVQWKNLSGLCSRGLLS